MVRAASPIRSLTLFGVLAFLLMVGAPYLHAHDPSHREGECPASQVLYSGAVLVPAPVAFEDAARVSGSTETSTLPLSQAEAPVTWQPRAPPC